MTQVTPAKRRILAAALAVGLATSGTTMATSLAHADETSEGSASEDPAPEVETPRADTQPAKKPETTPPANDKPEAPTKP